VREVSAKNDYRLGVAMQFAFADPRLAVLYD
jgi:hypothetical protein